MPSQDAGSPSSLGYCPDTLVGGSEEGFVSGVLVEPFGSGIAGSKASAHRPAS